MHYSHSIFETYLPATNTYCKMSFAALSAAIMCITAQIWFYFEEPCRK